VSAGIFPGTLEIEQGGTFKQTWTFRDTATGALLNLTGYTAKMQGRETYASATAVWSLSDSTGEIVLGGALGTAVCTLSSTATAALASGRGVWDFILTTPAPGLEVLRIARGEYLVTPRVSR